VSIYQLHLFKKTNCGFSLKNWSITCHGLRIMLVKSVTKGLKYDWIVKRLFLLWQMIIVSMKNKLKWHLYFRNLLLQLWMCFSVVQKENMHIFTSWIFPGEKYYSGTVYIFTNGCALRFSPVFDVTQQRSPLQYSGSLQSGIQHSPYICMTRLFNTTSTLNLMVDFCPPN